METKRSRVDFLHFKDTQSAEVVAGKRPERRRRQHARRRRSQVRPTRPQKPLYDIAQVSSLIRLDLTHLPADKPFCVIIFLP